MDPLSYAYSAADVLRRKVKDLAQNPLAYIEMQVDALRNAQRGQEAVGGEMRQLSPEERTRRMVDEAAGNIGALGVIKPRGGNWLSGRFGPEPYLQSLRKYVDLEQIPNYERLLKLKPGEIDPQLGIQVTPESLALWQGDLDATLQHAAANAFVDRQLAKYIKNDMGTQTDPVRLMLDKFPAEKAAKLAQAEAKVQALRQKQEAQAATRGVPPEMLTRTRQDVLAAEEARDLIAENTGLHVPIRTENPGQASYLMGKRAAAGLPVKGIATTPLARQWEHQVDLRKGKWSSIEDRGFTGLSDQELDDIIKGAQ